MKHWFEATTMLLVGLGIATVVPTGARAQAADPLAGSALYDDVKHYEQFGIHRYGSAGANGALDWLAGRLRAAGLKVEEQPFTMERQYFLDQAALTVNAKTIPVLPQWWIPGDKASFELTAPIARDGDAAGKFVRLHLSYDQGAYLNKSHRDAIAGALARKPAAVLLTIGHPSGEIFTYNVAQSDTPWPVPVILVAPKDEPLLDAAEQAGSPVSVSVKGRYENNVAGRNVIGRLDRGKDRTIVVSTPVTSWFTSTCERGPGIAAFLASASLAATSLPNANFVFVGTTGHEIGHGGMEYFIHDKAPKPDASISWIHYGASLGCYRRTREGDRWIITPEVDAQARGIGISDSLVATVEKPFHDIAATRFVGKNAAIGELREIQGKGYPDFVGMFGLHPLFHTPQDSAAMTGPAALEPVMRAFAATLTEISNKPKD
jgi:predicted GNAT family acetyltransferase